MRLNLDTSNIDDYGRFLRIKSLPRFAFTGHTAEFPDEYASLVGVATSAEERDAEYAPLDGLFDYQRDISKLAIKKRKFAVFADCGLGKTLILLEYAKHLASILPPGQCVLIVSPLMVVKQTIREAARFYGESLPIEHVRASSLSAWLECGSSRVGITNYDALDDDTPQGRIGALILDESSMLKSQYGKWGTTCIRLGKGVKWKLCLTGTPAPNDRIEYGNHAVFLDQYPTLNAFLARFFVNRGQTDNRWELKPHALEPFYRSLSHWAIFLTNPSTYGWRDNCETIPPIQVHIHRIDLTDEQREKVHDRTGMLFASNAGGITKRNTLARLAKGADGTASNKPDYIRAMVEGFVAGGESVIVWCLYNAEQDTLAKMMPEAANIDGSTAEDERERLIDDFKSGRRKVLISKGKILGFGLNLQIATRQVFSGLQDSYETYYQCVKRSNRYGATKPLNVHIPITEIEEPMIATVIEKAKRVQHDTEEQERLFRSMMKEIA